MADKSRRSRKPNERLLKSLPVKLQRLLPTLTTLLCSDSSRVVPISLRHCSSFDMTQNQRAYPKGSTFPNLTPGTLRLYSMRFCPFAQRTRLVLEHKQIPYETINVNLKLKPDWFLERNPLGLVPILEKDGKIVYESLVCDDYLEDMYPDKPLRPTDPYLLARDNILRQTFDKVISSFYKILWSGGNDEKGGRRYLKALQLYEDALSQRGNYFGGSDPSLVDFTVWPWIERAGAIEMVAPSYSLSRDRFPNLYAWRERMFDLPEVKATMFDSKTHLAFMQSLAARNPDYDIGLAPVQSRL